MQDQENEILFLKDRVLCLEKKVRLLSSSFVATHQIRSVIIFGHSNLEAGRIISAQQAAVMW
jgi:hypothetical protein